MKCFFLSLSFCSMVATASPLHVVIDPGHGGNDSGAVRGNAREADIALKVSELLKEILSADERFKASLTRSSDQSLSLQERVNLADKMNGDLFISVHANSNSDKRARGVEFYFQNHLPPNEETLFLAASENMTHQKEVINTADLEPTKRNDVSAILDDLKRQYRMRASHKFSRKLLEAWNQNGKTESNAIRQAPFYVVSKTHIPSVLIELGFITNPKEAERLMDPVYQKMVAGRIYQGIKDYKEIVDKVAAGPLQ